MNETVNDLRLHPRKAQSALTVGTYPATRVRLAARLAVAAPRSECVAAVPVCETASTRDIKAPATSLWRLSLAGNKIDRVENVAHILLAVGSAVSLLNGFWQLDYFLINWPSFVELMQRVFS